MLCRIPGFGNRGSPAILRAADGYASAGKSVGTECRFIAAMRHEAIGNEALEARLSRPGREPQVAGGTPQPGLRVGGDVRQDATVAAQVMLEPALEEEAPGTHAQAQACSQGSAVALQLGRDGV